MLLIIISLFIIMANFAKLMNILNEINKNLEMLGYLPLTVYQNEG